MLLESLKYRAPFSRRLLAAEISQKLRFYFYIRNLIKARLQLTCTEMSIIFTANLHQLHLNKKTMKTYLTFGFALALLYSCNSKNESSEASTATTDTTNYTHSTMEESNFTKTLPEGETKL